MLVHTEDFRTPTTLKMVHFVTKADTFLKKQLRNLLRKEINISIDKYPQTNTGKILHEWLFFQSKTICVNHTLFFIYSSFLKIFGGSY